VQRRPHPITTLSLTVETPTAPTRVAQEARVATLALRQRLGVEHLALTAVLAFSAVLNVRLLSRNGYGNIYYSAAVKSMLGSLHNFVFVSFDPGGLVAVDKPPLGLWVQALSAKLFGFSPLSLLLPEAILGVVAVGAMYAIVARRFGAVAGIASAFALAVFPSFVAVSRDNNLDTLLILLMLLGCGAGLRATETGRLRWLALSATLVGLAFNTKALAAYLVVPGIAVAYVVCAPPPWQRRLWRLGVAGIVLVVVSLAWLEFVDLTPASQRPYTGDTTDNNEVNLVFNYNGVGRVGGEVGGPGRIPIAKGFVTSPQPRRHRVVVGVHRPNPPPIIPFGGATGPLRLLNRQLGGQGGWLLPFALVGAIAIALSIRCRRDPRLAALIVLGGWFATELLLLSFSKGIIHPYYISALGPGAAAMVGGGMTAMAGLVRAGSWRRFLPVLALAATVAAQYLLLHREHYLAWYFPVMFAGAALSATALLLLRRWLLPAMAVGVAVLLFAPMVYSTTTWQVPVEGTFPAAGPHAAGSRGRFGVNPATLRSYVDVIDYTRAHRPATRWLVLTDSSLVAAPMILLGADAGSLGGYNGTDPTLDGPGLARLVERHEARYVLLGGLYWSRGGNRATVAVERVCRGISQTAVRPPARVVAGRAGQRRHLHVPVRPTVLPPRSDRLGLYDCKGRAAALAAA
jgi:4-amino-4-deoxy-L-arabinose transferase-like glycosyltransferase